VSDNFVDGVDTTHDAMSEDRFGFDVVIVNNVVT
jgi:hypothetical protein